MEQDLEDIADHLEEKADELWESAKDVERKPIIHSFDVTQLARPPVGTLRGTAEILRHMATKQEEKAEDGG